MIGVNKQLLTHNLERTGFDESSEGDLIYLFSLIGYLIVFGICIPYVLIKHDAFVILEGYLPNLDMIATVLGYSEGPFGIFKYLYKLVKKEKKFLIIFFFLDLQDLEKLL